MQHRPCVLETGFDEAHHEYQESQFGNYGEGVSDALVGNLPTGLSNPELLRYGADVQHSGTIVNGISRIGHMAGGKAAWWDDETMTDVFAEKAEAFINAADEKPFFLYLAMHQNHVPRIPHPRFVGTSGTGLRGDHVHELDWIIGKTVRVLKENGKLDHTIIIFSSDNGPVFFDSRNLLPALLGESDNGNQYIVQQSSDGLGLRMGKWKYIEANERSAWAYNRHNQGDENKMHRDALEYIEYLFDLEADPREEHNLAAENPEKLKEMAELLKTIKAEHTIAKWHE